MSHPMLRFEIGLPDKPDDPNGSGHDNTGQPNQDRQEQESTNELDDLAHYASLPLLSGVVILTL